MKTKYNEVSEKLLEKNRQYQKLQGMYETLRRWVSEDWGKYNVMGAMCYVYTLISMCKFPVCYYIGQV